MRMKPYRLPRWARFLLLFLGVVLGVVLALGFVLRASLPQLAGTRAVVGLAKQVRIERDDRGVPSIHAQSHADLAFAMGFLHGQDRFFQMDLMRRKTYGTLSEMVGPLALDLDRSVRQHAFAQVVKRAAAQEDPLLAELLKSYAAGVNEGLQSLKQPPPEYLLLRFRPRPWLVEDSYAVILAMFLDLQDGEAGMDHARGVLRQALGERWADYLAPRGSSWDAPLDGPAFGPPVRPANPPASGQLPSPSPAERAKSEEEKPGSNSWAVAGHLSSGGGGMLANDMHLGISLPNTWYRVDLHWPKGSGAGRATGVSLPGVPGVVAGSNGSIAWGFTNSYGDYADLIELEVNEKGDSYLKEGLWLPFEEVEQVIAIKGRAAVPWKGRRSHWGPVWERAGKCYALAWTAHMSEAVNFRLWQLLECDQVGNALDVAPHCGIPGQNLVVVDAAGHIGWTIAGKIPDRGGVEGRYPIPAGQAGNHFVKWLAAERYPRVENPANGRIWTANARVCSMEALALLGDGGYDLGARASQIRDRLMERTSFSESDFLAIQLDDQARFLAGWQRTLVQLMEKADYLPPYCARALPILKTWEGRASTESRAYPLVRALRLELSQAIMDQLTKPCRQLDGDFSSAALGMREGPVWDLLNGPEPDWLPMDSSSWSAFLINSMESCLEKLDRKQPLEKRTWGAQNGFQARHPVLGSLPFFGRFFNSELIHLPGDSHVPRVQGRSFGASQRMVVEPGKEEKALFHMPGGQSGHPFSPFYLKDMKDWQLGRPSPLLPGPAKWTLHLLPRFANPGASLQP
jgi:penicillin amidase